MIRCALKKKIKDKLIVDDTQFGSRPGKWATDATFTKKKTQKKHAFADLGKT